MGGTRPECTTSACENRHIAVVFQIKCRSFSFLSMKSIGSASKSRQWRFCRTKICAAKICKLFNLLDRFAQLLTWSAPDWYPFVLPKYLTCRIYVALGKR